jgi:hypothetical protein
LGARRYGRMCALSRGLFGEPPVSLVWQNRIVLENGSNTSMVGPPGASVSIPGRMNL